MEKIWLVGVQQFNKPTVRFGFRFRFWLVLFNKLGGRKKRYHFSVLSVFSVLFCISGEVGGPKAQKVGGSGDSKWGLEETEKPNTKKYTAYIASLTKKTCLYIRAMYIFFSEHALHGCETLKINTATIVFTSSNYPWIKLTKKTHCMRQTVNHVTMTM